jgi:hypothetical protein
MFRHTLLPKSRVSPSPSGASALVAVVALSVALWAGDSAAYEFYSDATNDQGGCAQCHTGFRDNNNYTSGLGGQPPHSPFEQYGYRKQL